MLKTLLVKMSRSLKPHRRVIAVCLLACLALIQVMLGEWLYTLFFIIFYIFMGFLPRRAALILVSSVTLALVFTRTPILNGMNHLIQIDVQTTQDLPASLHEILTPNSGLKQALPLMVEHMLSILQKHALPNYNLSGAKFQDDLIRQRVIESTWPIKLDPASKDVFVLPDGMSTYLTCMPVDRWEDVTLVHCP